VGSTVCSIIYFPCILTPADQIIKFYYLTVVKIYFNFLCFTTLIVAIKYLIQNQEIWGEEYIHIYFFEASFHFKTEEIYVQHSTSADQLIYIIICGTNCCQCRHFAIFKICISILYIFYIP